MKRLLFIAGLFLSVSAFSQAISLQGKETLQGNATLTAYAAPAPSAEIADTFTAADNTQLTNNPTSTGGYYWTNMTFASTYQIVGNVVTNVTGGSGSSGSYVGHTMSSANYTATIDIIGGGVGDSNDEPTLAIRYDGSAWASRNGYFVDWFPDTGNARLYKVVAGTVTQLGTDYAVGAGTPVTNLWIQVSGSTVTAKANSLGAANLTGATDAGITVNGYVGIGSWFRGNRQDFPARYDNLSVTVP